MSEDDSDTEDQITEEQVRRGFEEIYGVTVEEVMRVLEQSLDENHRLLKKMEEATQELEDAGFTEEEKESMQGIQDYVNGRNES